MKKTFILALPAVLLMLACRKNYTCACTDPAGNTDVFTIKDSRKNAEIQCKNFYTQHYDSIPLSERSCKLK